MSEGHTYPGMIVLDIGANISAPQLLFSSEKIKKAYLGAFCFIKCPLNLPFTIDLNTRASYTVVETS